MAKKLFADMTEKNVISWTSMMSGHVGFGESEEAVTLFFMMKRDIRVKPNEGTFVTVLRACGDLAAATQGMQVHQTICKTIYNENEHVISALISMYSKCGELPMAQKFFQNGSKGQRDLVSWNSMIAAYAHHGCGREAITLFEEMQAILKPSEVTYVSLLSACSHAGLVSEGLHYFELLVKDKSIKARDDHFTCVVDLCVRAGRLEEAFHYIQQHPPKTSPHAWATLLFGCDLHGDANMQKLVSDKINSANAGTYSLQSDEYNMTYWKDAETLNLKVRNGMLKKQRGCSWIEVGN